jgi:hypothetical protein
MEKKMYATRNGKMMYEVKRAMHDVNWPWIGKTWSPADPVVEDGEIAAANVWESPLYNKSVLARWAVVSV